MLNNAPVDATRRRALALPLIPLVPMLALGAGAVQAQAQDLMAATQAQYGRIEEAMRSLLQIYNAPGATMATAGPAVVEQVKTLTERLNTLESGLTPLRDQAFAQRNQDVLQLMSERNKGLTQGRTQLEQAYLRWATPPVRRAPPSRQGQPQG